MKAFCFLLTCLLLNTVNAQSDSTKTTHDEQFIQIFFHYGKFNELDTFKGTFQKDLVSDGTVNTTMWLTIREQEIILTNVERLRFFSLHDTVYPLPPGHIISPNMGRQVLKIKYKDMERTVIWDSGVEIIKCYKDMYFINSITELINDIIVSKPEYKALPPSKGAYY